MLRYMADTKKIITNHEQIIDDMDIFQANTNASLKNTKTQVGQLALSLQKQSKDTFLSDTQKNIKDCLAVTLRSGMELQESKKNEKEVENEEVVKEARNHKLGRMQLNQLRETYQRKKRMKIVQKRKSLKSRRR